MEVVCSMYRYGLVKEFCVFMRLESFYINVVDIEMDIKLVEFEGK